MFSDIPSSRYPHVDGVERSVVAGRIVTDDGELKVRYRHPVTKQTVNAAPSFVDSDRALRPGQAVRIVAEHDDPLSVFIEGHDPTLPLTTNLLLYGGVVIAAALPLLYRRLQIRRAERLASAGITTFAMQGALFRARFGRAYLALYALDAPAGSAPICSVRVLTTAGAPLGARVFPVEAKGSPRPLGRVVAAHKSEVLWPSGPALGPRRRHPRPELAAATTTQLPTVPNPQLQWRPAPWPFFLISAGAVLGSIALAASVTVMTLRASADEDDLLRSGVREVGEVLRYEEDETYAIVAYTRGDQRHVARAPAIFADMFPKGIRYPIRVDPDDPERAILQTEPYDKADPIVWGALPLFVAVPWFGHRVGAWMRLRRAARRGPWWLCRAARVGTTANGVTFGVVSNGEVICVIGAAATEAIEPERDVIVAGGLDPGNAVAAWVDGRAIVPTTLALVPESVPWLATTAVGSRPSARAERWSEPRSVEIKSFWFSWRKPRMDVADGLVHLTLPSCFRSTWTVPADQVAIVDLTVLALEEEDDELEGFETPFIQTTGNFGTPSIALLFKTQQRVPPVRWTMALAGDNGVPWGYRASRSEEGAWADGLMLRVANSDAAVRTVVAAGGVAPDRPIAWLRQVRPELWHAERQERVRSVARKRRYLTIAAFALMTVGGASMFFLGEHAADWTFALAFLAFMGGVVLMFAGSFIGRRELQLRLDADDP